MRNSRGFTLLEVTIAGAICAALLAAFFQFILIQSKVAAEEVQDTESQTNIMRAIAALLPLIQESRPTGKHTEIDHQNFYQFQLPIKTLDGAVSFETNSQGFSQFVFGSGQPGQMISGGYYEIAFLKGYEKDSKIGRPDEMVAEKLVVRSNGNSGVDLNGDGDQVDEFTFGTLILREFDSAGKLISERLLGGHICIPDSQNPLFRLEGNVLTITLIYLDMRESSPERSRIRQTSTRVLLRNGRATPSNP